MKSKYVYPSILFVLLIISGCGSVRTSSTPVPVVSPTSTSTHETAQNTPTPRFRRTPPPHDLDDISCETDLLKEAKAIEEDWIFSLVPGKSTIHDLAEYVDLSGASPVYTGRWIYNPNSMFHFMDGTLERIAGIPLQLGDMVAEFGPPEYVIWHIPRSMYDEGVDRTYLIYPDANMSFLEEKQVINFDRRTMFYGSIDKPENSAGFLEYYGTPSEADEVIIFDWPCEG